MSEDALLSAFCPPLDSTLVLSILREHDNDESAARAVLEQLTASTEDETHLDVLDVETESDDFEKALSEWTLDESTSKSSLDSFAADDPLSFLISVFPHQPRQQLEHVLVSLDGDVERAVEEILTRDLIAHENQLQAAEEAPVVTRDVPIHRKAKKQRSKQGKTISLTDVLHRKAPAGSDSESDLSDFASTGNSWVSIDSYATYFAERLQLPVGHVTSAYHQADSSWPVALENLLDELEASRPFDSLHISPDILATHFERLEGKRLLSGTNGDVGAALDLGQWRADRSIAATSRVVASGLGANRRVALLHADSTLRPASPLPIVEAGSTSLSRSGSGISRPVTTESFAPPEDCSIQECLSFAYQERARRNDATQKAARHFASGDKTMRLAASYYSQQAREHESRAKLYDMRAARATVKERQSRAVERGYETSTVDLHNLSVAQALVITKESVNTWWTSAPYPPPLRIIVGRGSHSVHGKSLIGPPVLTLLKREGWNFTREAEGVIKVTGVASTSTRY